MDVHGIESRIRVVSNRKASVICESPFLSGWRGGRDDMRGARHGGGSEAEVVRGVSLKAGG